MNTSLVGFFYCASFDRAVYAVIVCLSVCPSVCHMPALRELKTGRKIGSRKVVDSATRSQQENSLLIPRSS